MLAVFARMDVSRLEALLAAATGESSLQLVTFENQVKDGDVRGVPDGRISGRFSLWIETKTSVGAVNRAQLERHLKHMKAGSDVFERLLVVTPDLEEPASIGEIGDPRVIWVGFTALEQAINEVLDDPVEVVSEREHVLLRELIQMFEDDGLLGTPDDTVIVAASRAYDEYLKYGAYVCQPGRSFRQGLQRLGFYRHKRIEREVPRILHVRDNVDITPDSEAELDGGDEHDQALAALIGALLADDARPDGSVNKIFLLEEPARAHLLPSPVRHETSGAWTQGQRYTSFDALEEAETTEDL